MPFFIFQSRKQTDINSNSSAAENISDTSNFARFIESASFITVIVGVFYLIGWTFTDTYFQRLGINHFSLELSTAFYLQRGFTSFLPITILVLFVFTSHNVIQTNNRKEVVIGNIIFFLIIFYSFYPINNTSRSSLIICLIVIISTGLIVIFCFIEKQFILDFFYPDSSFKEIIILSIIVCILLLNAMISGEKRAALAIQGYNGTDVSGASFFWKDTVPTEISDKQVMLILHHKEQYYVIERADATPAIPKVYIIPDDLVKYVITTPNH